MTTESDRPRDESDNQWPYEYVEKGEVEKDMGWQKAKNVRQELERLRSIVDEWSCDECGENKSTVTKGLNGPSRCNDCAFGDSDE